MSNRGRTNPQRGEKSSLSKITDQQAIEIFNDNRTHELIAIDYGIAKSTVSSIKTGRNWKSITTDAI